MESRRFGSPSWLRTKNIAVNSHSPYPDREQIVSITLFIFLLSM